MAFYSYSLDVCIAAAVGALWCTSGHVMIGNLEAFREALLAWYDTNKRPFPWRDEASPYHVWVSEVMLQQTQATTVIPYYLRFVERFPSVYELAVATTDDVLKFWEGLGYYRRAHHLHQSAQIIVSSHGGELPQQEKSLLALPGVGRYTAGAIRSIAFGQPAPVLDGNIKRVLTRLDNIKARIDKHKTEQHLWGRAEYLLDVSRPGDFNQAMMELGSVVCTPKSPNCDTCPVAKFCEAQILGTQAQRPVRPPRKRSPHYEMAVGVVWRTAARKQLLILKRPESGLLGGLWEFPGWKQVAGLGLSQTLAYKLRSVLGIDVAVSGEFAEFQQTFSHFRTTVHVFHASCVDGSVLQCSGMDDCQWVFVDELSSFAFSRRGVLIRDELLGVL